MRAHACSTGPRTAAGKAASAANLEGHPTPDEAQRTRFNAMKHGLYARTATYFPAKPGKYDRCDGCEHLNTLACLEPPRACLKRHELMLRNQIAFETKDPSLLLQIRGDTQAALQGLIDDMILAIAQDGGPRISEVVWYHDKDGVFHLAKWVDDHGGEHQIHELKAHPVLKPLIDLIAKNSMTLADMGMTPRVQDEHEAVNGFLDQQGEDQESEERYRQQSLESMKKLEQLIGNSYQHDGVTIDAEVVNVKDL
ncbi:MAG: hypothetical protein GY703_16720 [Gammaproteobacteria bacterium]|nr:hypothetical protein [Gammaproteobacteria bacterium]